MYRNHSVAMLSFALTSALFLLVAYVGCEKAKEEPKAVAKPEVEAKTAALNSVAPNFTLVRHGSTELMSLSDLRGKVVLLNFWGAWCPPCRDELPELVSLYDAYKDSGVVVLGVLQHGSPMDVKKTDVLIGHYSIAYPNLTGVPGVFGAYKVEAYPTTFYIDRQGVIRKQFVGSQDRAKFEKELATVLHG